MEEKVIVDRRKPDAQIEFLTGILQSVHRLHEKMDDLEEVKKSVNKIDTALNQHIEDEALAFKSAFPGADPDGHRRAHEAAILAAEERAEFWQRMRIKAGELTLYGFLVCLVAVVVYYWNGHMPVSAHITLPK